MSMVDYTAMIDDIENAPEPTCLESGTEAQLRIISVNTGVSDKNDCGWFAPVFEVLDNPLVKEFNTFFWELEKDKLTDKQYQRGLSDLSKFVKAFNIDLSRPIDWGEDLIGKTGWAILGVKKDDEYGDKNTIRKFVVGA